MAKEHKWSKRQIKALKKSIDKWYAICYEGGADERSENCAFCQIYSDSACRSCPVAIVAGRTYCSGTPWDKWSAHHEAAHLTGSFSHMHVRADCQECKKLAKKELAYLRRVLGKGLKEKG